MSRIQIYEDEIVTALKAKFGLPPTISPYITADLNYEDDEDEKALLKKAKLYSSSKNLNSAIFVAYIGMKFDEKKMTGGLQMYKPYYGYVLMMFARNRRKTSTAHIDIYDLIETCMEVLYKAGYQLYTVDNVPVKIPETGLYRSNLVVGNYKPYPYQSLA